MEMALSCVAWVPGFVSVGRWHVPVYGMFAAAGLVAALGLSQWTAGRVGLSPERVWDAGVLAVVAAFVASRVLLVVFNLRAFLAYPLLVLALPSLTYAGVLLAGVAVWGYLRWKGMAWRDVADAWAPCACVLAAVLQVGHFVEGTEAGMPTALPWGVRVAGDSVMGKVHPVQVYAGLGFLGLGWWCWRALRVRRYGGAVASLGLMWGGVVVFFLDFVRQPQESFGRGWLDPAQFVAVACLVVGFVLRLRGEGGQ